MFDLVDYLRFDLEQRFDPIMSRRLRRNGNEPVIAFGFATLRLLSLDHSENARFHEAAGKGRLIHQQQHVEWIAIIPPRPRDRTEVERENGAMGQNGFQPVTAGSGIERILVTTASWRFDHDLQIPRFGIEGRKFFQWKFHLCLIAFPAKLDVNRKGR
jgi:hypothetical protein